MSISFFKKFIFQSFFSFGVILLFYEFFFILYGIRMITFFTDTVKVQMNFIDNTVKIFRLKLTQARFFLQFEIIYASAAIAGKMVMRERIAIKPVGPVAGNFLNLSNFGKKGKISVDSSKADVWKLFFYMSVNDISRRMITSADEKFFDTVSLSAAF